MRAWADLYVQKWMKLTLWLTFKDTPLALVHIPIDLYTFFLQPVLQIVFKNDPNLKNRDKSSGTPWTARHAFLNVSITPVECSIVCSRYLAEHYFAPLAEKFNQESRQGHLVSISNEDFIVIQVDGQGLDAGQRVLELTSPLAMAGISLFFITTYFSDYILVPLKSRGLVTHALEQRGFAFDRPTDTYVTETPSNHHSRNKSSNSSEVVPPSTPPPTTLSELQARTFALLKRRNISPQVDHSLHLVSCATHKDTYGHSAGKVLQLQFGLMTCLIDKPRFLSLTLTDSDPASLLLEKHLLPRFGESTDGESSDGESTNVLLGSKSDILIPIMLDLRELPLEATGIVCGVAGRLASGTGGVLMDPVEISFLSTARAGTVVVTEEDLARAMEALEASEKGAAAATAVD